MISFKNIYTRLSLLALCTVALSACSDWTTPQSVELYYASIKDQDPELYAEYLADLKEYKAGEHNVLIAKFDNSSASPVSQGECLSALPDSVDYVILTNPGTVSEQTLSDMENILEEKGTKTLFYLSYDKIDREYFEYKKVWADNHGLRVDPDTEQIVGEAENGQSITSFEDFLTRSVDSLYQIGDKLPFSGVCVAYKSVLPASIKPLDKENHRRYQEIFFSAAEKWLSANKDKELFFEGIPVNVYVDNSVVDNAHFIIIPATTAKSAMELDFCVEMALGSAMSSKIVCLVSSRDIYDDDNKDAWFTPGPNGKSEYSIIGAASWVNDSADFGKKGICVESCQRDYYIMNNSYGTVRKAISIMNPTLKH